MKVIVPGHRYELDSLEGGAPQQIQFIHKELVSEEASFRTVADGTTNEELLRVLIDRMHNLQNKAPCRENSIVLTHLEEALMWLDKRTANRVARGVEGTPQP